MQEELVCPIHGPYDSALGACPYCAGDGQRPPEPVPLHDDAPTDLGGGGYGGDVGDQPTDLGHGDTPGEEFDLTDISPRRRAGGEGFLDYDDSEETRLAEYRQEDVTELEFVETGTLGLLWVIEGNRRGKFYPVKNGTIVGRNKGNLILDDSKVSDPHAKFTVEDDAFVVWDFASSNGTFVNRKRIREATTLKENDIIKMGSMVFMIKVLPDPEALEQEG